MNIEKLAADLEILNAKRAALDNQIVADVNKLAAAFNAAAKKPRTSGPAAKKPAAKKKPMAKKPRASGPAAKKKR
ncbi:MAG: hypothetical protein FWH19_05420 [Treponema sp.]|nr:hypothetical protein [Treponema sp.]